MKAVIVMKINDKQVAVLNEDGGVMRIKNKNYKIGQVIEMHTDTFNARIKMGAVATVAALLLGVGSWSFFAPVTYVSLDVNPSIEYSVNRYNLVLSVNAVNGDGEEIIDTLHLKYHTVEDAVKQTVQEISAQGYFGGSDPASVMLAVASDDPSAAQDVLVELQQEVESQLEDSDYETEIDGVAVGQQRVEEAKAMGTTPGKLNLIEKLQESTDDPASVDAQEWLNKPVKEIMKAIKGNRTKKDTTTENDDQEPIISTDQNVDTVVSPSAEERTTDNSGGNDNANGNAKKKTEKTKGNADRTKK